MTRDEERFLRSQQEPIVGGLPDVPGILAAMRLTPGLGVHLRGLADELLVNDFPGATLHRAEREMIATGGLRGKRLLLLHGLARRLRDRAARAQRSSRTRCRSSTASRAARRDGLDAKMARCSTSRGPCGATPRDLTAGRRRGGAGRGRDRRRRPARRADRVGVLHVQPHGRRPSGRRPRRPPRPTARAPPRSPSTATATPGSRPLPGRS